MRIIVVLAALALATPAWAQRVRDGQVLCAELATRLAPANCAYVESVARGTERGAGAFNVPVFAGFGDARIVRLALWAGRNGNAPATLLAGTDGRLETIAPRVGTLMAAELVSEGFLVEERSPAVQAVPPGEAAVWTWRVTPVRSDVRFLALETHAMVASDTGGVFALRSTSFRRQVAAPVTWWERAAFTLGVPTRALQLAAAAAVATLGLWAVARVFRRQLRRQRRVEALRRAGIR